MSEQKICLPEGIEVIDAPFGGFPLLLYLLRGKKTVLVDTGVYSTPEEHILPWLEKHGMTPDDINQIIITHGHHDHFGGNFKMYTSNPEIEFMAHEMDYEWMEDHQKHFNEMYLSYTDQWYPDDAYEKAVIDFSGHDSPITTVIKGKETVIDIGNGMTITIYHTGAHSPGELLLYIKEKDCIITGDCIQVRGTMNESGIGTFPLFVNVEHYIDALNKIKELNCTCVCTAHTGILTREEANELIKESFAFMLTHQEHIIDTLKKAEKPMALHEIVKELHGKYYQVYEMAYQIHATTHAQCQYLKAKGILKRVPHNGKLLWSIK